MGRIHKIMVANRGEIACRVIRTAHALGYRSVAVYSDADRDAPHVELADEAVWIGPPAAAESYLNVERLLAAAKATGADAIHPGYGFLSENPRFVEACDGAGLCFIGPGARAMRMMGDKALAKARMIDAGVPTAPAYFGEDQSPERLAREAARIGFPLLVKATAGGGGRGIRAVASAAELPAAIEGARREAQGAFGDGTVMLEKRIDGGRHIEVQVFADSHGNAVYLGDRDCTAQRRRQKLIEEAPAPNIADSLRQRMGQSAVQAAQSIGYTGAGTVEFMLDRDGGYYFLEMNTRLQVEHPVTELVTGLDLVAWQIAVAEGATLPLTQRDVALRGHAIEARLYAEDPYAGFAPQTGRVARFHTEAALAQPGVRIDSGVRAGSVVSPFYDAMLAKLIVHGATREEATRKLVRVLEDAPLFGLTTNARFLIDLLRTPEYAAATLTTTTLDQWADQGVPLLQRPALPDEAWALACALLTEDSGDGFRSTGAAEFELTLECRGERRSLHVTQQSDGLNVRVAEAVLSLRGFRRVDTTCSVELGGRRKRYFGMIQDGRAYVAIDGQTYELSVPSLLEAKHRAHDASDNGRVLAPLAGRVVRLSVEPEAQVQAGDVLCVIDAMKMETRVLAERAGSVRELHVAQGDQVALGELLISLTPSEEN